MSTRYKKRCLLSVFCHFLQGGLPAVISFCESCLVAICVVGQKSTEFQLQLQGYQKTNKTEAKL